VLEQLILSALGKKPEMIRGVIQEELQRLQRGGYLQAAEAEAFMAQALEALTEHLAQAQQVAAPLAEGAAAAIRDMLDVPSRDEVRDMVSPQSPGDASGE
jgi:hypothetical protein